MSSQSEEDSFNHFIELNESLWNLEDAFAPLGEDNKIILVDLLSHDPHLYSMRALYIAKAIQKLSGSKLVGIVGDLIFSQELSFGYEKEKAVRLARSFGVTDFIDLEDTLALPDPREAPDQPEATIAAIRATSDADLPDLVLGLKAPDGCALGEYLYETIIRIMKDPKALTNSRSKLEALVSETYHIYEIFAKICRERDVEAIVVGHLGYTQWGMPADQVTRVGAKCFWFDTSGNFSAYLLDAAPAGNTRFITQMRDIDIVLFEREFRNREQVSPQFSAKVRALLASDRFLKPFWVTSTKAPPVSLAPALRKLALRKLGWPDASCPVVCVFIHSFTDQPRQDTQIYRDYYVWLYETLKIAVRHPDRKWVFKTHPYNRGLYDSTNAIDLLIAEFQDHEHIRFIEDEIERTEIFCVCDLAVSVRGSVSLEFTLAGKPVLLAGHSMVSDLGFCHVARSEDEYERLLTCDFTELALTRDMRERAEFFVIYDKIICRPESTFMPFWTYQMTGNPNLWDVMSERILYNVSDLDPVTNAVADMMRGGDQRSMNGRYSDITRVDKASNSRTRTYRQDVQIYADDSLSFHPNGNGTPWLLNKADRLDEHGSWFASGREAVLGLTLRGAPDRRPNDLVVRVFAVSEKANLHFTANGSAIQCLPTDIEGTHVALDALNLEWADGDRGLAIRLWLADSDDLPVHFRLDSIDIRREAAISPPPKRAVGRLGDLFRRMGDHVR